MPTVGAEKVSTFYLHDSLVCNIITRDIVWLLMPHVTSAIYHGNLQLNAFRG